MAAAPWLLRSLGSRVVVRGVSETHVGYRYQEGGEGVIGRGEWLQCFAYVKGDDE